MEDLVTGKILVMKLYGKAKVFLINQDLFDTASDEQLQILDEQIQVRKDELAAITESNKTLVPQCKEATAGETNERLKSLIEHRKKEIEELKL
jgi:hypothetical protein